MFLITQNEPLTIVVLVCLPVLLLDTRVGNLEAAVHCAQPCKSWLGKIRPVIVVTDLYKQVNKTTTVKLMMPTCSNKNHISGETGRQHASRLEKGYKW